MDNDSPLRWKLTFEGDCYDHSYKLQKLLHLEKMASALHDIKYAARAVLKHGDDTKEQYEKVLEEILETSWFVDDIID